MSSRPPPRIGLTISDVTKLVGVPPPTLRSWELRYGIPEPCTNRPPGARRRYSTTDLRALTLMRDEIARGLRAAQAANSVRTMLTASGPAVPFVNSLLDAAARLDPDSVRAQLDQATLALGLATCLDDVVFPALRQIGVFWQTGQCAAPHEHLLSSSVAAWLREVTPDALPAEGARRILLVPGPGEQHTIGLQAMHALLRHRSMPSLLHRPAGSGGTFLNGIDREPPSAMVFVCHLPSRRSGTVRLMQLAHRVADRRAGLFYAGNAFRTSRSRRNVPGSYLGTRLQRAVELVCRPDSTPPE